MLRLWRNYKAFREYMRVQVDEYLRWDDLVQKQKSAEGNGALPDRMFQSPPFDLVVHGTCALISIKAEAL